MTIRTILAATAALALLPAAAFAEHHEAGDMKASKGPASPAALAAAFCAGVVAEDAAALSALYTEDADSYGPGGDVVKGRAAIAASWAPFFDGFDDINCDLENAGEINNGKNATVWGLWTMTATPAGGGETVTMNGRYMDISVKQDGVWRYRADHASMSAPAGAAE